ncbi:MAG: hypothetical protein NDI73_09560 [Desulfuromonadales bacterium]|nr:hypothetical protein [Desulfuromonadales bacterium]
MDQNVPTKGAQHIEQLLQQLPPDSERYRVLISAKRFKSSWADLGESLTKVANTGQFHDWGYTSFEDYCAREIRIRRQTADKLLLAFRFLEREEPGVLERKEERPLPDFRSVDLLRQAREEHTFSPDDYNNLRRTVLEEDRSHPTAAKQFRGMLQEYQPERRGERHCQGALSAARRLSNALAELEAVPPDLERAVQELVGYLEDRLENEKVG